MAQQRDGRLVRSSVSTGLGQESRLALLVEHAEHNLSRLIDQHTTYMITEIDVYRSEAVSRDDVRRSVEHNMRYLVSAVRDPAAPRDLSAPRETGRRRAHQGVPLPEVLRAYRTGISALWDLFSEPARDARDSSMLDTLISVGKFLWQLGDEYSIELTESYRATTADLLVSQHQRRSALAEALFTGSPGEGAGPWELSKLLGLPADGDLIVVASENSSTAEEGLPRIETRLSERGINSAWRLTPALQMGVVSLRTGERDELIALLEDKARARVGVSPVYQLLKDTPRALHLARVALTGVRPGRAEVRVFEASPLAALVAQDMDEGKRIVSRVLGAVLELPADDREVLLDTLRAWFDHAGSAEHAAEQLYCHPNTVRYRLRRVQELTGRSLAEPYGIADLAAALQALHLDPMY